MTPNTDDVRIEALRPLIAPAILMEDIPVDEGAGLFVANARGAVEDVLLGNSQRLLVIVGPCSIHDPVAGLSYAERLSKLAATLEDDLFIVMRSYFEKPRTTVGWKGLINDPFLDGSFRINEGLRRARGFLRDVTSLRLPLATEFLDPISPQFVADFIAWGAIGARTTESQVHRELASGLSMPVGFKNATSGDLQVAIDAIRSARSPHHFLSVTKQGIAAIVETRGNSACHVILRGGHAGPNYDRVSVDEARERLEKAAVSSRVVIDCSHANSRKDPRRQPDVAADIGEQLVQGNRHIVGVMLESFLVEGAQPVGPREHLTFGQSITDACLGWEQTASVLEGLARAVHNRNASSR